MKHMDKTLITAAAVLAAAVSLPATAVGDDANGAEAQETRVVTEFRGSPPFKRRVVSGHDMVAESEADTTEPAADEAESNERVLVVDRRGAPPYKRRFVDEAELEVAEFARFEETSDAKPTRRGPPGKITSRR